MLIFLFSILLHIIMALQDTVSDFFNSKEGPKISTWILTHTSNKENRIPGVTMIPGMLDKHIMSCE